MKIDFNRELVNFDGVTLNDTITGKPITLLIVSTNALLADRRIAGNKKLEDARLAERIYKKKVLDLTVREIADLCDSIKETSPPLLVLRACEMLDGGE